MKAGSYKNQGNQATLTGENLEQFDFLFTETVDKKGKKKTHFLKRIFKVNRWPLLVNLILYVIQSSPLWIIPLISANLINLATAQLGATPLPEIEFWQKILFNCIILGISIVQNAPVTMLRLKIMNKMLRKTSAGIKCTVVRKLQSLAITYHKDMKTGKIQSKFLKIPTLSKFSCDKYQARCSRI